MIAEDPTKDSVKIKTLDVLPVDIVNAAKSPASKLKVAKMIEFGVLNADSSIDPNNDSDCFSVRVRGGALLGPISVRVATTDNPNPAYNDDPTQIDLHVDGNDAITDTMLLMSDDEDDHQPIDGIADDQKNDRSHKSSWVGN